LKSFHFGAGLRPAPGNFEFREGGKGLGRRDFFTNNKKIYEIEIADQYFFVAGYFPVIFHLFSTSEREFRQEK
jgi:hypothetical protein